MNLDELQELNQPFLPLARRDRENLISFLNGFILGKGENFRGFRLMGKYLKQKYGIEKQINSWMDQIDHYAFIKETNFVAGFYELIKEIKQDGVKILIEYNDCNSRDKKNVIKRNPLKSVNSILLDSGNSIKTGDQIELVDKIGENYKRNKYYDANIKNPSWELFYRSDDDFKKIRFYTIKNSNYYIYDQVYRIFSGLKDEVIRIGTRNGIYYAYTNILEIEINQNQETEDFKLLKTNTLIDEHDIDSLKFMFENYQLGLFEEDFDNFNDMISYWNRQCFMSTKKPWQKYTQSLLGTWSKTT